DNRVDLVTEYIQINYHNAAQIYKALTEAKGIGGSGGGNSQNESGFLSGRGRLVADERTTTPMISDIPKQVEAMTELIRVIDRPVDQVLIEARVVIASETFAREIGAKVGINGATGKPGDRSSLGFGSTTDISGANASARAAAVQAGRNTYTATRGLNVDLPARLNDAAGSLALSILNAGYMLDLELS
ncbi:secretin N-terminal domain-containing protein, partial [Escherichia coli]|uniref:secretin N-terminal domain-containing protein n=1 Tax=Escherichia coli TaxID=562 RepID=UPI001AEFFB86